MNIIDNLSMEQHLLVLTSRLTFSKRDRELIQSYAHNNKFNWFEFFKMALYHKTATLCWNNINSIVPDVVMPTYLYYLMRYSKKEIELQNRLFLNEFDNVISVFKENGVTVVPVKGCRFIKTLYGCNGTRFMGDFDLLVRKTDGLRIKEIMNSLGYIQGKVDFVNDKINPISRAEDIKWKMSVSNFAPYFKMTGDECNKFFKFDFRHSLNDDLRTESTERIILYYEQYGEARPAHLLVHLCTHFYGEAKRTISIFLSKDFNIIKLTDIREYVIKYMNEEEWTEVLNFVREYSLERHLYFTLYFLNMLFQDGYEQEIMNQLEIEDDFFLCSFGDNTLEEKYTNNRTFIESIFSCSNYIDIEESPNFLKVDYLK